MASAGAIICVWLAHSRHASPTIVYVATNAPPNAKTFQIGKMCITKFFRHPVVLLHARLSYVKFVFSVSDPEVKQALDETLACDAVGDFSKPSTCAGQTQSYTHKGCGTTCYIAVGAGCGGALLLVIIVVVVVIAKKKRASRGPEYRLVDNKI
ncbi:uncharacterized protein LOC134178788 [Corticium candelabrum]|uniref:uncharacterized protein LOC134178788 n=1 Tax=Corticium candelabrum TaxID=121492 RepID=UPI002E26C65E|nr:uncharacterized protein LOC134178788 [Corticium candelabrum]